jgi:signal transduction histidine kinase/ActR/RegA family two-component response regulator
MRIGAQGGETRSEPADRNPERSFRAVLGLAIVVPAVLFLTAAWYDYSQLTAAARRRVITTAEAIAEHAQKVLETNQLVLSAVSERISGLTWDEIRTSEALHRYLDRITHQLPQLESTFVVDPDGKIAASSRAFPMPPYDVTMRDYFLAARQGNRGLFISSPFAGQHAGTVAFTVTRPPTASGIAGGLVGVTLSPGYFERFYADLIDPRGHALASLIRADGVFLIRYPPRPDSPPSLAATSFLTPGGAALHEGVFTGRSRFNGRARLGAVHAVAGLPLYASYSIENQGYLSVWYQHIAVLAAFAVVLIVVLSVSAHAAIRHARRERSHLRVLLTETARREEAEEAVRQLQKIEALGRLTGGVAHDFNNLLTAIMGSLELAMKRVEEPRVTRLLEGAMEAAKRGARLTQQMLAFSRQQHVRLVPLSVNDTVTGMTDLLRRTLTPEIDVTFALEPQLWAAMADPTQLEVAVLNLAINARDAMKAGGALMIRTANVPAEMGRPAGVPAGDLVAVSVRDEGEGMTEEVRRRAIEPFFTTKGVGQGTGLGLSMVHGFVVQTGGGLAIESEPGDGTTVSMFLPRATVLPEREAEAAEPLGRSMPPLDILLVDDDTQVRALTADMLRELGHRVAECGEGAEAIRRARDTPPDLLIIDYAMPGMNGGEVARAITDGAARNGATVPILFMSGYAEADALQELRERGHALLAKPFTLAQLAEALAASAKAEVL